MPPVIREGAPLTRELRAAEAMREFAGLQIPQEDIGREGAGLSPVLIGELVSAEGQALLTHGRLEL